jgi:integrase
MDKISFTEFDAHADLSTGSDPVAPEPAAAPLRLETFADVDAYIADHPDSPVAGRASWRSSCRRAAWSVNAIHAAARNEPFDPDMKKLDLATVPFDIRRINAAWKGRSYRAAGFTSKSAFRNARWAIRRIGRIAGTVLPCFIPPIPPGDPFEPLLQAANKYEEPVIRLFRAWCGEAGLSRDDINDDVLPAFSAYVTTRLVGKKADAIARLLARLWNDTARRDPTWPQTRLSAPRQTAPYSLPLTAYPPPLQESVAGLMAWMAGTQLRPPPHPRPGRKRSARPATIRNVLTCVRLALSALVGGGRDPGSITGLGCMLSVPALDAILQYHEKRAEARQQALPQAERYPSRQAYAIGAVLVMIAQRYCGVSPEDLKALREVVADFRVDLPGKPTLKNQRRVDAILDDPAKLKCLMRRPAALMEEALALLERYAETLRQAAQAKGTAAARLARQARCLASQAAHLGREAALIGILCRIPLRIKNLQEIRIGTNLQFIAGGADVTLNFTAGETKNRIDLRFYIGPRLHALLRTYIEHFLPSFAAGSTDFDDKRWLFPSGDGRPGPISIGRLRTIIVRSVADNVGATVNPHLFRAIAVTLALRHSPDALEHCRLLLGDKSLRVVLRYYAIMKEKDAARRQSAFVDAEEDRLTQVSAPPSNPRRGRRS